MLEDHPLLAVPGCLFSIFAAVLHIWRPSPPSATGGRATHMGKLKIVRLKTVSAVHIIYLFIFVQNFVQIRRVVLQMKHANRHING